MTDNVQTLDQNAGYGLATSVQERNKVLRNTYWLLALSLVPTVLGAWVGCGQRNHRVAFRRRGPDGVPRWRVCLHLCD